MKRTFANIPRDNDSRYFETTDGTFIAPLNLSYFNYLAKVDLSDMTFISKDDEDYNESTLPTINDLIDEGKVRDKTYCREYCIELESFGLASDWQLKDWGDCCDAFDDVIDDIIQEFAEHGFKVSKQALCHNYSCWLGDMKSGYRGRGYHLFTPCGCNLLSFSATSLDKHFDWQTTYEW